MNVATTLDLGRSTIFQGVVYPMSLELRKEKTDDVLELDPLGYVVSIDDVLTLSGAEVAAEEVGNSIVISWALPGTLSVGSYGCYIKSQTLEGDKYIQAKFILNIIDRKTQNS